ncbi:MAG: DNA repair protein RadA [Hyphomicrobiaceae bacterium]
MAKAQRSSFVCQNCGGVATRWVGKCPACGEWNTLVEETDAGPPPGSGVTKQTRGRVVALETLATRGQAPPRLPTGIAELDRVAGGGIVQGSALLIGGEPGIGKSTLLLQLAASLANNGHHTIYFSGEEAAAQVRLRAERLGLSAAPVLLASETNLANILATLSDGKRADLIIIDSIQTLWADALDAAPGTVSQVRAATQSLIRHAKQSGSALVLVGHVTKDGQIAGPKVVEHMVDTVLSFEGDRGHPFRILRATKNRFGATDEIGVFEMATAGLREVANPSELFLGDRELGRTRAPPFLPASKARDPSWSKSRPWWHPPRMGTPRRAVVRWDSSRLAMVLAVLDARCGVSLAQHDVYLNVAGGLRITEPAADLAAAAALLSSLSGAALPSDHVYFGEISLSGAVRAAGHMTLRLKEASKLGFKRAILPAAGDIDGDVSKIAMERIGHLKDLACSVGPCQ